MIGTDPYMLLRARRANASGAPAEIVLQELLARGPRWFAVWWLLQSPESRDHALRSTDFYL